MSKLEEARDILKQLGLPSQQQNEISGLTLLALCDLSEGDHWSKASKPSRTIHQMLEFMRDTFGKGYAENTRETVRRRVIHQLEQARVVDRNPDNPDLATNSPRTHYALTDEALLVIRSYQSSDWESELRDFLENQGALLKEYQRHRKMREIPVRTSSGEEFLLSPGPHNKLQAQIIEEFGPKFAPSATLLYFGDTARKLLHKDDEKLAQIGVNLTEHDKLPDVVLYDDQRNWLFLVEAVTSHGPVSPKRVAELEITLKSCDATRIYVSAFPDFKQFKKHANDIAWETEVWIAAIPDHMIHFDGEKFLAATENSG